MPEQQSKERTLLVDVSMAKNSAQAVGILDDFITRSGIPHEGSRLDVNAGPLLLTPNVLAKMKHMVKGADIHLETIFSTVPQTQQAALDEGFYVKEKPLIDTDFDAKTFLTPQTVETVDTFLEVFPQPVGGVSPSSESARAGETLHSTDEFAGLGSELPTLYLKHTLRSGKVVRFDGNIVIVGDVHAGSEISAGGDISVWGELRGIAHAGSTGNYLAEIRALRIEAIQLRIADYIARRPDRIFYHKSVGGEGGAIAPEVAKVADGEIKIFKEVIGR